MGISLLTQLPRDHIKKLMFAPKKRGQIIKKHLNSIHGMQRKQLPV